jgi:MoxR-like ATPase
MSAKPFNPLKTKLQQLRDLLSGGMVERDEPVRLAFLAALAGEHILLIGPPGTAKSELARRLHHAFALGDDGSGYFERLLTRFSVPEELFGPLSIKGLEQDRYERKTDRYLPTASVAFIDEIFKANSAILNSLLTLLNEREFDNGAQRHKTPLVCVVGASNELPEGEELDALYDRFLIRYQVLPVSPDGFYDLLDLRGARIPEVPPQTRLTSADLALIQIEAEKVTVPSDIKKLLAALRAYLIEQKVQVSDRRWRKALHLLQVAAFTDGRNSVSLWDAALLQHALWQTPDQRESVWNWYLSRVGAATPSDPEQFSKATTAWEERLKEDQGRTVQVMDEQGKPLFVAPDGKPTAERNGRFPATNSKGEKLYLRQANDYYGSGRDRTNSGKGFTRKAVEQGRNDEDEE